MRTCLICGTSIEHRRRDAKTCSGACRMAACRGGTVPLTRIEPASVPSDLRKPSLDDLAILLITLSSLEASFRFAAKRADFKLRPRCHRIADALLGIIEKEGMRDGPPPKG